jgi:GTP-binding protein EngB required for normal cell division
MKGTRDTKRQERRRHQIPSVAIAGYTNAGKSSLLNRLTDAGVLVENSLFATLDPTTRRTTTADGRVYTMSDTVGFVRHLPHQLVEAFRSTLEEVADSDLILHVVDGSHPDPEGQIAAVREVFAEIGADKVPELIVINKADAADPMVLAGCASASRTRWWSARRPARASPSPGAGRVRAAPPGCRVQALLPYDRGDLINRLHQQGEIDSMEHTADGTLVEGPRQRRPRRRAGRVRRQRTGARPDLVVLQGGLNETDRPASAIRSGVRRVLARLEARGVPARDIVIVGPVAAPRRAAGVPRVDGVLADEAERADVLYLSMVHVQLPYLPDRLHLTVEGHREFGRAVASLL